MTLSEALGEGLQVTVIGLTIVFSVLVILMLVLMAMKTVFYRPEGEEKAQAPVSEVPQQAQAQTMDEGELIAVLTAAVAASMNTSTYHLNIKSYRRIDNTSPAWNKAGRQDVMDARF